MEVRVNIAGIGRNWQPWVSARFLIWTIRKPGRQWQEMVENGRQWQRIDFRVFLVVVIEVTRKTMAEMAENGRKRVAAGKWQEMDFRVFLVVAIEVEKRRSGKNGGKWSKMAGN